jgi:crotonobetainyl-CoA:carnitine CoA-transferase CaiB-like acyl-CoA transferase
MTNRVMEGIRIVEVAEHTFVPAASAILADWGADVIKVEHAERGDAMRGLGQTGTVGFGTDVPVLMEHANRGKRSIGLDLSDPDGLAVLHKLVATADVFLTNKLPRVVRRLGIDVDDVRAHNPTIVYVRGTGYGVQGPDADAGGYDYLGYWSRAGVASALQGADQELPPGPPSPAYGDSIGAMTIAGGIAAALLHRERTGEAHIVDVSLLGTGMWALSGAVALSQLTKEPWKGLAGDMRGTPSNPLVGMYDTADGRAIAFSMLQGFHYWPDMCRRLGLDHLVGDPRFATAELLMANAPEAGALVASAIAARPLDHWVEAFTGMPGQWSVVQDTVEVGSDPQVVANGYLQQLSTADGRPYWLVATPVQFDGEPAVPGRAPELSEHGDAILTDELGFDWDTVVDLKVRGVVT